MHRAQRLRGSLLQHIRSLDEIEIRLHLHRGERFGLPKFCQEFSGHNSILDLITTIVKRINVHALHTSEVLS